MNTLEIVRYYTNKRIRWSNFWDDWSLYSASKCKLEGWYREAREVYSVELTYEDFSFMVSNNVEYLPTRKKRFYRVKADKSSFTKKPHHSKKVLTDDDVRKREWKKSVSHGQKYRKGYYCRGGKKGYRVIANRKERREIKRDVYSIKTNNTDWDNYSSHPKGKYLNWWDYY